VGRILGFDYGRARIGLSVSDERKIIVSSLCVCKRHKNLIDTFKEIQSKTGHLAPFELLVVGHPLLLNGTEGEMALEARAFAEALSSYLSVPYVLWDERLSSAQADRLMKEGNLSRKQRSEKADTLSSTLILQNYLDRYAFTTKP
jgi:putative holliday junction resolvase